MVLFRLLYLISTFYIHHRLEVVNAITFTELVGIFCSTKNHPTASVANYP